MPPAIALVGGALLGVWLPDVPDLKAILVLTGVAALVAWARVRPTVTAVLVLAAYVLCGTQLAATDRARALRTPLRDALDAAFGGFQIGAPGSAGAHPPLPVRGRLVEDAALRDGGVSLRLAVDASAIGGRENAVAGVVLLNVNGAAAPRRANEWRAGRTLELPVAFRRPARYLNEGVSDFERDTALDGVTLGGTVKSALLVQVVARGNALQEAAGAVRAHVRRSVATWMAPRDPVGAATVAAILIGDRTGLSPALRDRLQAAGIYHVIAISGGNIAILAGLLVGCLAIMGVAPRTRAVVVILGLAAYAAVVTSGPSVWRATLTAIAYLAARACDHRSPPWNAVAVSAAVLVCLSPLDVRNVGFALTFGATLALIAVTHSGRIASSWPAAARWLVATVAASAAVQAVLLPIEATAFSRVSVAGIALNLAALPLMTVAQIAGLVVAIAPCDVVARNAAWVAGVATSALVHSADLVERLPWLVRRVPPPVAAIVAAYYLLVVSARLTTGLRRHALIVLAAGAAALIVIGRPHRASAAAEPLTLTVFDVGQGDAMLLSLPDGTHTMVDTGGIGYGESAFDIGARVLEPALWARGVYRLNGLTLTHGDPDHTGGALTLIRDFHPHHLYEGVHVDGHAPSEAVRAAARRARLRSSVVHRGAEWVTAGVRFRVLHPPPPDWERVRVRNDDSIVLEVRYGDVALLLTGDISAEIERELLPRLPPAPIRILKVAHHGSRTSTSQELLEAWRPDIAVISCGRGNTFGHPHPDVLRRLNDVGATLLRTDRQGQITIETDGKAVSYRTYVSHEAHKIAAAKNTK